ncbi:hypothetical protein B0H10DRAFT_1962872 [Mycena sp. CBHHK59/15]|nr:hypothetical protein B0H10DRAFT_1962872 [Mycena sp. CBHHK59/15]
MSAPSQIPGMQSQPWATLSLVLSSTVDALRIRLKSRWTGREGQGMGWCKSLGQEQVRAGKGEERESGKALRALWAGLTQVLHPVCALCSGASPRTGIYCDLVLGFLVEYMCRRTVFMVKSKLRSPSPGQGELVTLKHVCINAPIRA